MSAVDEWNAVRPEANNIMPRLAKIADAAMAETQGILVASKVGWEAEIERLKVCGNCHWMHCDFDDCTDDVDGELPGGCSPDDHCHFTPSRWTEGSTP